MTATPPGARAAQRLALAAVLLAVAATALTACHRPPSNAAAAPMFIDDHGILTIPADSPLRIHLAVETVGGGDRAAVIELPAPRTGGPRR